MNTDQEIQEFIDMFGDSLPDPEHYPRTFAYFVRLYRFQKAIQQADKNKENK